MKGAHRIPAVIIITFIVVGVVNYLPTGGGEGTGNVKPAERPTLWGLTDPPILQNVSWERSGNVETAMLPKNIVKKLEEQLWALGYYPVYANWSDCRWTIWSGRRTYYVGKTDDDILVARGSWKAVLEWVNETSKCGKPGWPTRVIGPSPEKALAYTTSMIGNTLEKNGVIVVPSKWDGKIPWNLANYSLTAGKVKILILIYAIDGQVNYARSLVDGKTLCISSLGYKALLVLRGPGDKVERVLRLIEKTRRVGTRSAGERDEGEGCDNDGVNGSSGDGRSNLQGTPNKTRTKATPLGFPRSTGFNQHELGEAGGS